MKLRIDIETPMGYLPLKCLRSAIYMRDTSELIESYPPGEDFIMNDDKTGVKIRFTVLSTEEAMTSAAAATKAAQLLQGIKHGVSYFNVREEWAVAKALTDLYQLPEPAPQEARHD